MADLAGRSVALSPDVPALFDAPLGPHHKLIGRWAASRDISARAYTRVEARRRVEHVFDTAVLDILEPIELADFRVAVLQGGDGDPPAIAMICDSMGQLDLGWIEDSDAPIPWRAALYRTLELMLGRVLPIFGYDDLFESMSMSYWDGATEDEAARQCLIDYHGVAPEDLDAQALPSAMDARRPEWMIRENAAPPAELPAGLRQRLHRFTRAHEALGNLEPDQNAWHLEMDVAYEYLPGLDECSSLPPLTLVPVEQFAREVDDVGRYGMELGFMDLAGICPLRHADRIDGWFASLQAGAEFLVAAQALIQLDPAKE